ncbi:MAG: hypothetical protein EAY70_06005 [Sphingomonadales bacterium]|nr:MAG: hypothetical protein EAY70_06005 [Sphingomonadales bacterium]
MKAILAITAALLTTAPLAAQTAPERSAQPVVEVIAAADAFFVALRSDDKTALARQMIADRTIIVTNRMDPSQPRETIIPVAKHLENWTKSPPGLDEHMIYRSVFLLGDTALVSGPYRFLADGQTTHCGTNTLMFEKTEGGWKLGNTSFTMEPPSDCERIGAPEAPAQ